MLFPPTDTSNFLIINAALTLTPQPGEVLTLDKLKQQLKISKADKTSILLIEYDKKEVPLTEKEKNK